jgi:multidrug efflux pump subunit AcrA (membrane-fusion protein)
MVAKPHGVDRRRGRGRGGGRLCWWQADQKAKAKPVYVTEALKKGTLSLTVSANGTLQPTRTVNVGSGHRCARCWWT